MTEGEGRARRPLSREVILDTAVAIADADGIDAVSMRRVGTELGVQAMSLYNHVASKDDLLDGMAGRLLAGMDIPRLGATAWKDAIRTVGRAYRRLAHEHPAVFPVIHARPLSSPESLPPLEATLAILVDAGFDPQTALDGFIVVSSYVAGFALSEIGNDWVGPEGLSFRDQLPPPSRLDDRYPVTASVLEAASPEGDRAFELGLDLLLEGLEGLRRQR